MGHRHLLVRIAVVVLVGTAALSGCHHVIPVQAQFQGTAQVAAQADVRGEVAVKLPAAVDPGPIVASSVQSSRTSGPAPRVAIIDVDGLLLNQNAEGLLGAGENPVAVFREKLTAASSDGQVVAVVLRIHSPGGGVTACDIMADELERFRTATSKPVVACLMDVATAGAYYLAIGADRVVAQPTTITAGIGAIYNHVNLQDAMAQLNVLADPVKAGSRIDMGSVTGPLDAETRVMLEEMAGEFQWRFLERVARRRTAMTEADRQVVKDGRIISAPRALSMHLVDRLGSIHDALQEAEQLAGVADAEVVLYHRAGTSARSLYAISPTPARLSDAIPLSYPGLDRSKLPSFLYLWQPDPTVPRTSPR